MFEPGSLIAQRFVVERPLGAGGMGKVFQVRHATLGERFALKVLLQHESGDSRAAARFQREAKAAAGLRCEHVVRVIDFGYLHKNSPFLVMEFVEGQSLASLILRYGPMHAPDAVRAALHACAALAEAHAAGIIHRDIKPSNLLLASRSDGSPLIKLADFGVAKLQKAEALTDTHSSLGSPAYMAPEQIRDARGADPRSDVWSVGVTLFELLSGQTPFHAFTAPGILSRVLTDEPTPLLSLCPALPPGLVAVVERCLKKDPDQRFASVLELADALAPFAPEPGEDARVRRISAHARRAASEPPPAPALADGQTTHTNTSLTQAPEASLTSPHAAEPAARPARSASRLALPGALAIVALAGLYSAARRPQSNDTQGPAAPSALASSAASVAAPTISANPPSPPASPSAEPPRLAAASERPAPPASAPPANAPAQGPAEPLATSSPSPRRAPGPSGPAPAPTPRSKAHPLGEFGSRQ